jgi:hypothetical protein
MYPKTFSITNAKMSSPGRAGIIVVQLDGMDHLLSFKASKAFVQETAGSRLPNRVLWIKAAAEKYPYNGLLPGGIFGAQRCQEAMTAVLKPR